MKLKTRQIAAVILLVQILPAVIAAQEQATQSPPLQFEIKDQFDRLHTEREFDNQCVLLVCGDRKGSSYQGQWVAALRDSLQLSQPSDRIALVEAADLRGVPFFVKGSVKKKFPRDETAWVLMDWKGRLPKTYDFQKDKCNIALFDRSGMLIHKTAVEDLSVQVLDEILLHAKTASQKVVTTR